MEAETKLGEIEKRNFNIIGTPEYQSIVSIEYLDHLSQQGFPLVKIMKAVENICEGGFSDCASDSLRNEMFDAIDRFLMDKEFEDMEKRDRLNVIYNYRCIIELLGLVNSVEVGHCDELRKRHAANKSSNSKQ